MKYQYQKKLKAKRISTEHLALKELRLKKNWTLKDAGMRLGLSSKSVGAIENGRVLLPKKRIEEIVNSYGLTYLDFERTRRIIKREGSKRKRRRYKNRVLQNSDRRSYQKIITKECRVLKSLRRMKKFTQDKAAKLCVYPRATIGHIENGRIELSRSRIDHILKAYSISYSQFEGCLNKTQLRDEIIEECVQKIESLEDKKLELVKNLLESF